MSTYRHLRLVAAAGLVTVAASSVGIPQAGASIVRSSHHAGSGLKLINAGYLTVGTDATYPPMESGEPGHYVGADVDLANALAKSMGLKGAQIVNNTFDTLIPSMTIRHKFDVIMSSMNDTPTRHQQIDFVDYMRTSQGILVRSSSSIHTNGYAGLCGHSVSVESGTTELLGLQAANKKCGKISIKIYAKDTDAYQAFAARKVESYTSDLPVVALYSKNSGGSLRLAGKPFAAGQDYGIGLQKNQAALRTALSKALAKIRANGQYRQILTKWGVGGASL